MLAASTVLILLVAVVLMWTAASLVGERAAPTVPSVPNLRKPTSGAPPPAAAALGVVLAAVGAATSAPLYWSAAAVAAIAAAAAIGVRLHLGDAFGGPAYAVPSLAHLAPGTPGAISAPAAAAAAGAAFLTAALAFGLRLLGPSDPALVALAAYLGMLLDCLLEGLTRGKGTRVAAAIAGAAGAALLAGALVVLLP